MQVYLNYDCILKEKEQPFVYDQKRAAEYGLQYNKSIIENRGFYQTPVFVQKEERNTSKLNAAIPFSVTNRNARKEETSELLYRESKPIINYSSPIRVNPSFIRRPISYLDASFLFCYNDNKNIEVFKLYNSFLVKKKVTRAIDVSDTVSLFHNMKVPTYVMKEYLLTGDINHLDVHKSFMTKGQRKGLHQFLEYPVVQKRTSLHVFSNRFANKNDKELLREDPILTFRNYKHGVFIFDERQAKKVSRPIKLFQSISLKTKEDPSITVYRSYFSKKENKGINVSKIIAAYNNDGIRGISVFENRSALKSNHGIVINTLKSLSSMIRGIYVKVSSIFGKKDNRDTDLLNQYSGKVESKYIKMYLGKMGIKDSNDTFLNQDISGILNHSRSTIINNNFFGEKDILSSFLMNGYFSIKDEKTMMQESYNKAMVISDTNIELFSFDSFAEKESLSFEVFNYLSNTDAIGSMIPVFKGSNTIDYFKEYFFVKNSAPGQVLTELVRVEKNTISSMLNQFVDPLQTNGKRSMIEHTEVTLNKHGFNVNFSNEIQFIKKAKESALLNSMIGFGKGGKQFDYGKQFVISKNEFELHYEDSLINISKNEKEFNSASQIVNINLKGKDTVLNDFIQIQQKPKETFILYNDVIVNKERKESFISKNLNHIFKDMQDITIDYSSNFINKRKKSTLLEAYNLDATKGTIETRYENTELHIKSLPKAVLDGEFVTIDAIQAKDTVLSNMFWVDKSVIGHSDYFQEIKRLTATKKELEKNVEHHYNWVWTEGSGENPLPQNEHYGIDELLIPENDFDYSRFEDIIFNKKTLKPIRPVKIIDDHTFVAKYPIKHPIQKYEDVAKEYIDIPSDLMYTIYIRFYEIWYANVFKFGNMDMVAAINLMMDYMYIYVMTQYSGTDYLKEALRVLKQIRWFAETSIIKNAEYLINFEYDDLKSNLHTGYCEIQNRVENFYIDKNLKVFSSDSTNFRKEAYIEFTVANGIETTMTFSISFLHGHADVYINGEHELTINRSTSLVEIPLEATKTVNKIKIVRDSASNVSYCYIGNIIVKNGKYKNLNITFDNTKKNGNLPLNDVIQKLINFATMYENNVEVFNKFKQGNMAMSALFEELKNYWNLHHEGKVKGKRLTIKET